MITPLFHVCYNLIQPATEGKIVIPPFLLLVTREPSHYLTALIQAYPSALSITSNYLVSFTSLFRAYVGSVAM